MTPMTGPRERQTQRQGLKGISTLLLSIATFNVLGLSDHAKRYDLAKDCYNYNIDILFRFSFISVFYFSIYLSSSVVSLLTHIILRNISFI